MVQVWFRIGDLRRNDTGVLESWLTNRKYSFHVGVSLYWRFHEEVDLLILLQYIII